MPKGGVLHLHYDSFLDKDWVRNAIPIPDKPTAYRSPACLNIFFPLEWERDNFIPICSCDKFMSSLSRKLGRRASLCLSSGACFGFSLEGFAPLDRSVRAMESSRLFMQVCGGAFIRGAFIRGALTRGHLYAGAALCGWSVMRLRGWQNGG